MLDLTEFLGTPIVPRDVPYKGKTRTFHFLELCADDAEGVFLNAESDPKKNKGLRNKIIAKVVCDESGAAAMTPTEAGKLPNELSNALVSIALEINGLGKKADDEAKNA